MPSFLWNRVHELELLSQKVCAFKILVDVAKLTSKKVAQIKFWKIFLLSYLKIIHLCFNSFLKYISEDRGKDG